ncbi:glycosyltransferase [Aurantibacillus circumpalustris]|uniref:glycosyltransferase n=1 Tax=Aurantibacillus circumpalustris TaxID=3036359 RepID=UPI00295BA736|nr:glycosyltransferase [Aurantibacillus circumpalustris]
MFVSKTIFISPIDWGLGHASRCVRLIEDLSKNNTVIIGTTPLTSFFFDRYFPKLQKVEVPSYKIAYSKRLPLWIKLLLQWPKIKRTIREEKKQLEKIVDRYKIDLIISDNRFGLSHPFVHSIFITHQLNVKTPFFSSIANNINRNYIHKFNEVWVPDFEDPKLRLSGELSDSSRIKTPVKYIGPQSALTNFQTSNSNSEKYDYLILLSGVEPQRTILENCLLEKFKDSNKKIVFVRGSNSKITNKSTNIRLINFCFGEKLQSLIVNSETVICRSGYSTLMDLYLLNKKNIILIPTPGQTEQEYLADYFEKKFKCKKVLQREITEDLHQVF